MGVLAKIRILTPWLPIVLRESQRNTKRMNISLFRNEEGAFTEISGTAGLENTSGWWSCIQVADLDNDGDPDLIGGNLGLNSFLRASLQEPVEMYMNDFDNNGTLDQVICAFYNGTSYPIASLDELAAQITGLKEKYPTYADFGGNTAREIFGEEKLDKSLVRKAVHFESTLFLNKGDGTFEIIALPKEAQFSPVRDIHVLEYNNDGMGDLILAGNNYSVRPSIGRYDASPGWCLMGTPDPGFRVLMPLESGLTIDGDARKIEAIEIAGQRFLVVAVNKGDVQLFHY